MMYVGIVLAGLLSFMLGGLWYTILFGKSWTKAVGLDDPQKMKEMKENSNVPLTMGMTLVFEIGVAAILAFFLSYFNVTQWSQIILFACMLGLFAVISNIKNYLYENKSLSLFLISEGYKFLGTILMAVVLKFFL